MHQKREEKKKDIKTFIYNALTHSIVKFKSFTWMTDIYLIFIAINIIQYIVGWKIRKEIMDEQNE